MAATPGNGIAVNYDSSAGILTLNGEASPASYQQVLRTVTYENSAYFPNNTSRILNFMISDGTATVTATTTLSVLSPLVVTRDSDSGNGANGAFGSLSLALSRAGNVERVTSKTISFSPTLTETTVTSGNLPVLPPAQLYKGGALPARKLL